ncbi:sensor histidine kinase [Emticicia sp. BO119]|uniref:tetratricopeptide repeat-containing sensor histidine kinase n=1 Tax=Emticicia sp. BO119 TaxID=2757768 RepID=UPI001C6A4C53|nr:sensor histidine kinase [Emticicia sp. BO119]
MIYAQLEETKKDYEKAIAKGDSLEVADACYNMGKRYISIGDFFNAEKMLTRALRILEPLGPSENLGRVYIFMTNFLLRNDKYDEAMEVVQKAAINFRIVGAQERLMSAYIMLCGIHNLGNEARLKQPQKYKRYSLDSANYYRNQADKIGKSLKKLTHPGNIAFSNDFTFEHNDASLSIKSLKKAYNLSLKKRATYELFSKSLDLGTTYFLLQNFSEAKNWLDKAKYIADTSNTGSYDDKNRLFKTYYNLNKQTQNYKEALQYYEQYHELLLMAISSDRDGAVSRLKIEYDTQKKEAELKEQEKFTKIAIAIGAFALLTSIIFFWFFRKYRILSKQNEALVSEQNHRVKNNLQQVTNLLSLQSNRLNDENAKRAVNDALLRIEAVSIVHHRLYDGARLIEIDLASFIPELTEGILRSYDYPDLQPDYQIASLWLHVEQALPLGLIINELVTNACKYAFPENPIPALTIHCYENEGQILLQVSDNGLGFEQSTKKKTFGLKLIQIFTERLKGKSGFENEGTAFYLTFQKQAIKTKKNLATTKVSTT